MFYREGWSVERLARYVGEVLVVGFAYVVAANLGRLAASYGIVTAVWPPSGVSLAMLLLRGVRVWPGVSLGVFVTVGVEGQPAPLPILLPPGAILAMVTGNTLEAVVGAVLLRRFGRFSGCFDTVREVVALLLLPIGVGATISATFGVSALFVIGALNQVELADAWWTWWVGNALGLIVLTPFLTSWSKPPRTVRHVRLAEVALLLVVACLSASHAVFGMFPAVPRTTREVYLLFPVLVWAALRLGPRGASTAVFAVSALTLISTAFKYGQFGSANLPATVLRLQVFVGVMSSTILLLAASIAERQRTFEELRALKDNLEELVRQRTLELQASNRDLESFASQVSHDLRAPVRAIRAFTTLLQEDHGAALPPEARALLERVARAASRMALLIEALLEYSRVGRREVHTREVDVAELVAGVVGELPADPRRVEIVVGALPTAYADPAMLRQVFANLLENAVKYTRTRANPRIEVGAELVEGAPAWYVRDNGVGFDMRYADKLFQVFSRLPGDTFEGTGIGLAIVQRIVNQHGGRVWALGKPDRGATFWFTLGDQPADQK